VGLLGATDQRIETFSTGMCTRLGIAASLVADPPLLLWDEPTAGLDPSARRFTLDLIREFGKAKTVVVATHILSDIDQICDHIGVMHEGRMIFTGSTQDMKRHLRCDAFRLELDGDAEDIQHLARDLAALEGVHARLGPGLAVLVEMTEGRSRAGALADALKLVDATNLLLKAIHSGPNATEDAYLQLLQEHEAHGFHR